MNEDNLETVTSLSRDLSTRENITFQLEELLIAGNYDEAKLLLEPSQPVDIADAIGSLPQILQALAFRLLKKNEAIEVYEYFFISIIASFSVGLLISKRLNNSVEKILLSGFFSCFTSFSGFIYFLYKVLNQGEWIKFIIFFNLIIIVNLFAMFFGFWISRKIT